MDNVQYIESPGSIQLQINGKERGRIDFEIRDGQLDIVHTEVDTSLRGHGYAAELVERAATLANREGYVLHATCKYAVSYFARKRGKKDTPQ